MQRKEAQSISIVTVAIKKLRFIFIFKAINFFVLFYLDPWDENLEKLEFEKFSLRAYS